MELLQVLKWIAMCFMVSCFMRPFLHYKNLKLFDAGFSLSLGLGTALSFFTAWLLATITPLKFDSCTSYFALILLALAACIFKRIISGRKNNSDPSFFAPQTSESIRHFVIGFLLFAILFLIAVWVKGFNPAITNDTEKFMDFGFVQTIYRQKSAIPEDLWFSGETLNYYYLGHAACVFLCRLSFVTPEYGYNLMLCSIFAMSFTMILSAVSSFLASGYLTAKSHAVIGGTVAASLACFGANGHYLVFGVIAPILEKITNRPFRYNDYGYFCPDSTVYIGTYPETLDKGKTEFLSYTLTLGDLHAHAINIIFVIPLIAMLFDLALDMKNEDIQDENVLDSLSKINDPGYLIKKAILSVFSDYRIIVIGILLGLFRGTNYWDFPIYFVISGAVILFTDLKREGMRAGTILKVLLKGAFILAIGTLCILPFSLHFEKMASQICFANNHSPFYKIVIIWGIPFIISILFLLYTGVHRKDKNQNENKITKVMLSNLAMTAIILCAAGLVLVPEIIYVKDIYGEKFARFNTMFKLTYQAFVLFSMSMGIAAGVWLNRRKKALALITIVISAILSTYIFVAIKQLIGNVFNPVERIGISAFDPLYDDESLLAETSAIYIINSDPSENIHIMEKYGHSYSPECRISVFTGACTVAGWEVHEWMWRNNWDIVAQREGEIGYFYMSGDQGYCKDIIDKYDLDYIFVGPAEWGEYAVNTDGFSEYCEKIPVSEDPTLALYKVLK